MTKVKLFTLFCLFTVLGFAQTVKQELVGHVNDAVSKKGIEGVRVQLVSQPDIVHTDSEGKYRFKRAGGYTVGRGYSVLLYKEGYINTMSTDNLILNANGMLNNLFMKSEFEKFLWITVKDGLTNELLSEVKIEIQGQMVVTNELGRAKFDFSRFGNGKAKAVLKRNCYQDETVRVDLKGEEEIKLIPICGTVERKSSGLDPLRAAQLLDRALESRNGSKQGQVEAIEYLRGNGYDFNSVDFSGVNLSDLQLPDTKLASANFDFADLTSANLSKGTLSKNRFYLARADNADFSRADLSLSRAAFMPARKANFQGADLTHVYFIGCDFSDADFSGANLEGAIFALCNLSGATFDNARIINAGLSGNVLDNASFEGAEIRNTEIAGSVVSGRKFEFSEEQRSGLCKYLDGYRRIYMGSTKFEFKFELIKERNSTYRKYDEVVREYAFFDNFGGGNCKICDAEKWKSGKWRDYYSFFTLIKTGAFLGKNDRVNYTQDLVKKHLGFLQEKLILANTYRVESDFKKWDAEIKSYFKSKRVGAKPDMDIDLLTMQMRRYKIMPPDKIPWKLLAYRHLTDRLGQELDKKTTTDARGFGILPNLESLPPAYTVPTFPLDWVDGYRSWINKSSGSDHRSFRIPLNVSRLYVKQGRATFEILKGSYRLSGEGYPKEYAELMLKNGIDPDRLLDARVPNSNYYSGNDHQFYVRYQFPDTQGQYAINVPEGTDKKDLNIRIEVKLDKMRLLGNGKNSYLICDVVPVVIEYRINGSENWERGHAFDNAKKHGFDRDKYKSLKNRALLNKDVVLAAMLKEGLLTTDDFRLSSLASKHVEGARNFIHGGTLFPYQFIFPKHVKRGIKPFNYVEKYAQWLSKNAKIGVETFSIELKYFGEGHAQAGKTKKVAVPIWDNSPYHTRSVIHDYLMENQIEKQQVREYPRSKILIVGTINNVMLIYPKHKRVAHFEIDQAFKKEDVELRLELKLDKIDYVQGVNKKVVLYSTPVALFYRIGDQKWKMSKEFGD